MDTHADETYAPAPFDGRRFHNLVEHGSNDRRALLKWMLTRQRGAWPQPLPMERAPDPPPRVDDGTIRATVVGHSTVLLQVAGLNFLTDPIWTDLAGPIWPLGVKRTTPPAFPFESLPKIDVVLLSHNHYDHCDRPTLRRLARRDAPLVITGLKVGRSAPAARLVELDWWSSRRIRDDIRATYVPARHFSARGLFDRNASLWGGFVVETDAGVIYFAGDTASGPHFRQIRRRFGPMDLSLIPIGAYEPRWMMSAAHIGPAEALEASLTLESLVSVAIHHRTFRLADDAFEGPSQGLAEAKRRLAPQGCARGFDFRAPPFGVPVVAARNALVAAEKSAPDP